MPLAADALLELIRQDQRPDVALVAMLDLFELEPSALSSVLIQAIEGHVMYCETLGFVTELLPDECAQDVYRFAWEKFKAGDGQPLVSMICSQAARSAPELLHDDWDAVLRLSEVEQMGSLFWRDLPHETGSRCLESARGASAAVQRVTRDALEAAGIAELQTAACMLDGVREEPWLTIGVEAGSGNERGTGRALHGESGLHLRFDARAQRVQLAQSTGVVRRFQRLHPTWAGGSVKATVRSGGRLEGRCGICGARLQRLLDMDVRLVGPCSIPQVTFGLCLDCPDNGESGWCHGDPVYFRHDEAGRPDAHESQVLDARILPDDSMALLDSNVELIELASGRWQPCSYLGGWQNYSRAGGVPSWIQGGMYLSCPDCRRTMFFVMQVDSHLALTNGTVLQWMNGGMLYTFWCDQCWISGHYSQYG